MFNINTKKTPQNENLEINEEQIKLVILDSTPYEPTNDKLNKFFIKPNIILKKYPDKISGLEKVADGLDCIKTEFSVLCADDDFLIPHSSNSSRFNDWMRACLNTSISNSFLKVSLI